VSNSGNSLNSEVYNLKTEVSTLQIDLTYERNKQNNLNSEVLNLKTEVSTLQTENYDLKRKINSLSSTFPFKIEKIEIGNTDNSNNIINNYGGTLYASQMRYLKPKIHYTGFVNGKSATIYYKIFKPDGTLNFNSSYSTIYTGDGNSCTIYEGSNNVSLKGWGNASSSTYTSGAYRIEIWYNGICFGTKSFTIR